MNPRISTENKMLIIAILVFMFILCFTQGHAANFTSSTTGNWSNSATWGGAGIPGTNDNVTILHGTVVTVNGTYTCNNLTIGDVTSAVTTVNVTSGNSLTINGLCNINPNNCSNTYTLNAGPGAVSVAGTLSWSSSGTNIIQASTGAVTFTPAVTISSANQNVKLTGAGTINFNSSFTDNYNKLTTFAGGTIKFAGNYTVTTTAANWNGLGTALFSNTGSITANSNLTLFNVQTFASASTTLASASGTVVIGGAVTLGSGSTFTANKDFELDGNWTNNGGTFSGGSNTVTFNLTTNLSGTTAFPYIQIGNTATSNTVSLTLNSNITCAGVTLNGYNKARTLTVSNGDTLTVNGNVLINQPTAAKTNNLAINGGTCLVSGNLSFAGTVTTASFCSKITVTTGSLLVSGTTNFDANTVAANQLITLTSTGIITFSHALTMAYGTLSNTGTGTINFNGNAPSFNFGGSSGPVLTTTNGCTMNFFKGFANNNNALTFAATSNCNFTNNGSITANAPATFGNTWFNAADTLASTGSAVEIAGNCTLASGASFNALQNLSLTGNWLNLNAGSNYLQAGGVLTINGDVIDSGTITASVDGAINLAGTGANISGTGMLYFPSGTITITNDKTITAGTSLTFGTEAENTTLNIASATTISNAGTVTLYGSMTGTDYSSTWLNNVDGALSVTGALLDMGFLDASTVPNTVTYNGNGAQTITTPVSSYYNLIVANTGIKTMIAPVQVDNAVVLSGSVVLDEGTYPLDGLASLTMTDTSVLKLERNTTGTYPELDGAYSLTSGTVIINQTDESATVTSAQYYNLILNGTTPYDISGVNTISNNFRVENAAYLDNTTNLTVGGMFTDSSTAYSTLYNSLTAYGIALKAGTLDDNGNTITINGEGGWEMSDANFISLGQTIFYTASSDGIPQTISGSTPTTFYNLQINNPGDNVTLNAPVVVSNNLDLTNGNILTDATNILRMTDSAIVVNGSSSSYVAGPMIKQGSADFIFPIGKGGVYGRAGISGISSAATEVTAEYFNNAYSTLNPKDTALSKVSGREYWMIERGVTTDSLHLELFWTNADNSGFLKCQNLTIAHYTGGKWINEPAMVTNDAICSGNGSGSLISIAPIGTFSPFSFGSDNGPGGAALPIKLLSFNAIPNNKVVLTNWKTALEINNNYFTVERSADAEQFTAIGTVNGAGNSTTTKNYDFTDENPLTGTSYYRLRQTDFDGHSKVSNIVAVNMAGKSNLSVYPNPAKDNVFINVVNPSAQVIINVYNMVGEQVFSKTYQGITDAGSQLIAIPTAGNFPSGIYTISASTNGNLLNEKLVVQ